jgi:methionyl-tRNA formyltransferase
MRVILITGSIAAIPVLQWLQKQQFLCGVAAQEILANSHPGIEKWIKQLSPEFLTISKAAISKELSQWIEKCNPDLVFVYGLSWILPKQLFELSKFGFFNIHFSLLPAYKGPAPLFWQLKKGEKTTGISIHEMTEKPDSGKVVIQMPVDILPGENFGLLTIRLAQLSVQVISEFFGQHAYETPVAPIASCKELSTYQRRPESKDLLIDWKTMQAEDIENMVNAANPVYNGATCFYKDQELRLIEVNTMVLNEREENAPHGSIMRADEKEGIVIKCVNDSHLQIKIVGTAAGILSWQKCLHFSGIEKGQVFT